MNEHYSLQLVNDTRLLHVRTIWVLNRVTASVTVEDWYFDPGTKLPVSVQYVMPDNHNPRNLSVGSIEFDDFRPVSGIMVPFRLVGHGADLRIRTFLVTSFQTNTNIDAAHFELKGGQQ